MGGAEPAVVYTASGECPPDEIERDVPGWRGVGPVLAGNRARGQLQLGVFGDLFTIVALYVSQGNVLDAATGWALAEVADLACDRWRSKDSGMWELPEARQNAWSEDLGAYVWYSGSDDLDASILLHAISGFDRGKRMSATLDALRDTLRAGPHLYRLSGARDEGEGAFIACGFWLASALHLCGRAEEAREQMDELVRSVPNDVGLMAEMIDPGTGDFLGNLP